MAQAKELALESEKPSRLLTVATLTGHAIRAVGCGYSICLDNGPARESGMSNRLFEAGHLIGEPFEISTLRREDFKVKIPFNLYSLLHLVQSQKTLYKPILNLQP